MKVLGLWVFLLVVIGTAFMFHASTSLSTSSSTPDTSSPMIGNRMKGTGSIRKLKQGNYNPSTKERKSNLANPGNLHLEDYHLIDPSPSSRSTITSGPIEHGTPIIPYIPKVAPPSPPNQDGGSPPA